MKPYSNHGNFICDRCREICKGGCFEQLKAILDGEVKEGSEEYEKAKNVVFSEPPVDNVYDETADLGDSCYVLIIEALPGQYDQRADSAARNKRRIRRISAAGI